MQDLKIIQDLKKICKTSSYKEDKELIKKYSADWRGRFSKNALGVTFPSSAKEVSKIIKYSNKKILSLSHKVEIQDWLEEHHLLKINKK